MSSFMVRTEASRIRQAVADVFGDYFFRKNNHVFVLSLNLKHTEKNSNKKRQINNPHNSLCNITHVKESIYIFLCGEDGNITHQAGSGRCSRELATQRERSQCASVRGGVRIFIALSWC